MNWQVGDWWRPGDRTTSEVPFKNTDPAKAAEVIKATTASATMGQTQGNKPADASKPTAAATQNQKPPEQPEKDQLKPTQTATQPTRPARPAMMPATTAPSNARAAFNQKGQWKIVAFASSNYLGITKAWYDRLTDLGYTEHVVAAMDDQIFAALAQLGYRVEDHVVSPSEKPEPGEPVKGWGRHLWKLWRYRLAYVNRQTQMGRSVFLVDVDTMWNRKVELKDMFDGTPEDAATDVFFSQGTVYPHDAFDAWGFVGCMGSVAFRATPRTSALLKAAMEDCKEGACDDQVAMNGALLRKYGIQWNRNTGLGEGALAKPVAARLKVTDPNAVGIKVRMWPKPFAFRSFMKDVKKVETASLGADGGAGGVCLGQVEPASLGEAPITTGPKGAVVDYARPFIVAPLLDKDGEKKLEAWNKFQRFCFVIQTPEYRRTALPSPLAPASTTTTPAGPAALPN